jgi:hypothetical protein
MLVYSNGPGNMFLKIRNVANKIHENIGELFTCMMCLPQWVGMAHSILNLFIIYKIPFTPMNVLLSYSNINMDNNLVMVLTYITIVLIDGFIASGTSWVIHNIEEHFEKQ